MRYHFPALLTFLISVSFFSPAAGGEGEAHAVNNGQDITAPLTRLDVRYGYQNIAGAPGNHDDVHTAILRMDKPFVLAPKWLLAARVDVPFVASNPPSLRDNPRGDTRFGMGDALAQALLVNVPNKNFAWAAGAQVIFPTASEEQMGTGTYRVVPTVGARFGMDSIRKGSWVALAARWDRSFADSRANTTDVNELQFAPVVNIWLPNHWFVNLFPSPDIRYNLGKKRAKDTGRWFIPANALIGKMLTRKMVATFEVGVPIVKDYAVYDFKAEFRLGIFF